MHFGFCCSNLFKTFELEDNLEYSFELKYESQLAMNLTVLCFDIGNTLNLDSLGSDGFRVYVFLASGFEKKSRLF